MLFLLLELELLELELLELELLELELELLEFCMDRYLLIFRVDR